MIPNNQLTTIPHVPGVYFFKDAGGQVIYIGKAKDLQKRVRSYFQKTGDWKINALLQEHTSIDYLPTRSEIEALLLEASIIAEHKPKFNVLLKDGQPFVYVLVTSTPLPYLKIVRNKKSKGTYFGPFINKQEARRVYQFLMRAFRLTLCNKTLEHGCLDYHIGICAGNCRPDFNQDEYLFRLSMAQQLLKGKYTQLQQEIEDQIARYSSELKFEQAQYLSECLSSISSIVRILKEHFDPKKFTPAVFLKTAPIDYEIRKKPHLGEQLQALLGLKSLPVSIDCFDISHFQSQSMVGSCIRFVEGIPDKNNFRKFKIRTLTEQNDCAALQEIVRRRYRNTDNLPNLILIDGGKGQRNAVKDMFPDIDVISIAKREERVFSDAHPDGVVLDIKTDVGQTLIALRDYAHHFAISYHRKKQQRSTKIALSK